MKKRNGRRNTKPSAALVPPQDPNAPRLALIDEACAYSRLTRNQIYNLVNKGLIISVKPGRARLIDLNSVDRYLKSLVEVAC